MYNHIKDSSHIALKTNGSDIIRKIAPNRKEEMREWRLITLEQTRKFDSEIRENAIQFIFCDKLDNGFALFNEQHRSMGNATLSVSLELFFPSSLFLSGSLYHYFLTMS